MSLKDIEKLREKVDKDPNSKLFVPLAEEYRKEGMMEEAISVLLGGIEKQPGYTSARVSLGKIYMEKEMLPEALAEFEFVIKAIPDNLYAHKKLAEIYRATGNTERAIRAYKTVLKLNNMDEEALISLSELEGLEPAESLPSEQLNQQASDEPEPAQPDVLEHTSHSSGEAAAPAAGFAPEAEGAAGPSGEDDLAAFHSAIFGNAAEDEGTSPADLLPRLDSPFEAAAEPAVTEAAVEETTGGFELGDVQEIPDTFEEPLPEDMSFGSEVEKPPQAAGMPVGIEGADQYISEGRYGDALKIYNALLASNPGDRKVLQRVEELRQFLRLIGKDKEALVAQLNSFMEGIETRRDEFFRHS